MEAIKYKVVGWWSGHVFMQGRLFDDSEEAWREAEKLNQEISADAVAVEDDGRGTAKMERFYLAPRTS
jgi:hypothetical protein